MAQAIDNNDFSKNGLMEREVTKSEDCRICGGPSDFFDEATVLHKHSVAYFRCNRCGFIQTEAPYWLEEAYSTAIARQDTGILLRNLLNRDRIAAILNLLFPRVKSSLDFGAGHGIFVRLMRDAGFDFYWFDPHATNDYARGFEHKEDRSYEFLTAFEVLEHLADPLDDLSKMMALSPNVLVSTELLPSPPPKVSKWWYYSTSGGQHISFYTPESLRVIARRFGRNILSNGSYHLFTKEAKSNILFQSSFNRVVSRILKVAYRRPSLTWPDFEFLGNSTAKTQQ
jgi:hypothetical protein